MMIMAAVKTIRRDSRAEVQKEIAVIRHSAKEIAASRESARAFLRRAGIVTKGGKLTKAYR